MPESPGPAQSEPSKDHPPEPAPKETEDLSTSVLNESASVDKNEVGDGADSNEHPEGYYQDEDLKAQRVMAEATESIVSLTRIQIALGVIGTFALIWTLYESRRATNLASRTARRELRAYVSGRPEFVFSFDNASLAVARYRIDNQGQTPAHKLRHAALVGVFPHPLPAGFVFPAVATNEDKSVSLFAKSPWFGTAYAPRVFTTDEITRIKSGEARIYVWGIITYEDIFGADQTTNFASSVVASADTLEKLTSGYAPADLKLEFESVGDFNTAT